MNIGERLLEVLDLEKFWKMHESVTEAEIKMKERELVFFTFYRYLIGLCLK